MAHPWNVGDAVQVKIGSSWVNATVDAKSGNGKYLFTVTDDPLPTLADCGLSHPRLDSSTKIKGEGSVKHVANDWGMKRIRDPI